MNKKSIGVIGAGPIGCTFATLCAIAGYFVTFMDASDSQLERGVQRIKRKLDELVRIRALLEHERLNIAALLRPTKRFSALADCKIILETESVCMTSKGTMLRGLDELSPDSIIASYASVVPFAELMTNLERPERYIGLRCSITHPEFELESTESTSEMTRRLMDDFLCELGMSIKSYSSVRTL